MEQLLNMVIGHDTIILSCLIAGIAVVLLLLMILNFSSPEAVVLSEYGRSDEFEGTLRRVLGDRSVTSAPAAGDPSQVVALEAEVLEKDQKIAELQKVITAGGAAEGISLRDVDGGDGPSEELLDKIKDLEARLEEYEIIEDDIADLSKFKSLNADLNKEVQRLKGLLEEESPEPEDVPEEMPEPAPAKPSGPSGEDLVAEFEKIVSQGEALGEDDSGGSEDSEPEDDESGDVVGQDATTQGRASADGDANFGSVDVNQQDDKDVKPDSKEEAEFLINDLKNLKQEASKNENPKSDSDEPA